MKKLLVLLLVSALAIFVFAGCDLIPPSEGEGEGEGEGEVEGVTVEIDGAVTVEGKTYVSGGSHGITVTFPAPVENTLVYVSGCDDDSKGVIINADPVAMWPNEDKTIWTGSYKFSSKLDCCSAYIMVEAGECESDVCVYYPVIVDTKPPYAGISVTKPTTNPCTCGGCAWIFKSGKLSDCAETPCCYDKCSGLASWSISVYDDNPFKTCCTIPCAQPVFTCSGTACPIECTTDCLTEYTDGSPADGKYYVIVSLVDNVGNDVEYYAIITQDSACTIEVQQFYGNVDIDGDGKCDCTDWNAENTTSTYDIGDCIQYDNCVSN